MMKVHGLTERRPMAERLETSEVRFMDQDLRRHADGHYVWLDSVGNPLFDEKGQMVGAILSARDIIGRGTAEEASSGLAAIVESSDDAIIDKTLSGVITSWNQGTEKLYGYSAEEVKGKPISILLPPNRPDELMQILERLERGERVQQYETERMRKDGKIIDVSLTVSAIRDPTGRMVGA